MKHRDISKWDVSSVANMGYMFSDALNFNQPLGSWTISKVTDMTGMFRGSALSTENYDVLLLGWATQSLKKGVLFDAGETSYCSGANARANIIANYGWTIRDGGKNCHPILKPLLLGLILLIGLLLLYIGFKRRKQKKL